jgi:hypothetical protein
MKSTGEDQEELLTTLFCSWRTTKLRKRRAIPALSDRRGEGLGLGKKRRNNRFTSSFFDEERGCYTLKEGDAGIARCFP